MAILERGYFSLADKKQKENTFVFHGSTDHRLYMKMDDMTAPQK